MRLVEAAASRSSTATRSASRRAASTRRSRTRRTSSSVPAEYASRVASFYDQTVADVYELYQRKPVRLERRRLRRHALPHRRRARALPRSGGEVAEGVPLRARRRVPGHEPRAVPAAAAAGGEARRTCSRWAIRTSASSEGSLVTMADGTKKPIEDGRRRRDRCSRATAAARFGPAHVMRTHRSSPTTASRSRLSSGRRIVSTPGARSLRGFKVGKTPQIHMTYLMWKRGHGYRIGTSRTYTESRAADAGRARRSG